MINIHSDLDLQSIDLNPFGSLSFEIYHNNGSVHGHTGKNTGKDYQMLNKELNTCNKIDDGTESDLGRQ